MKNKKFAFIDEVKIPKCLNCKSEDNIYEALDHRLFKCCQCGTIYSHRFTTDKPEDWKKKEMQYIEIWPVGEDET